MSDAKWSAPDLHEVQRLAASGANWLVAMAQKAVSLFKGVLVASMVLEGTALALGVLAVDGRFRIGFVIVGLLFFSIPTAIAWWVHDGASTVATTGPQLVKDLTVAARDPAVRAQLTSAVGREILTGPVVAVGGQPVPRERGWRRLRRRSSDVLSLRSLVWGTKNDLFELWGAIVSLARVPWSLMVIGIGWAVTALWCLLCVVVLMLR